MNKIIFVIVIVLSWSVLAVFCAKGFLTDEVFICISLFVVLLIKIAQELYNKEVKQKK